MKKSLFATLVCLFSIIILQAQDNKLVWGNSSKQILNISYTYNSAYDREANFLGTDSQTKHTFWYNKSEPYDPSLRADKKFSLTRMDSANNVVFSKDLQLMAFPESSDSVTTLIHDIVFFNNKLVLLLEICNTKKNISAIYLHELNLDGNLTGKDSKIGEVKSRFVNNKLTLSPDQSSLLVSSSSIEPQTAKPYYLLQVFDKNLSIIHNKKLYSSTQNSRMLFDAFSLEIYMDNTHRIFFLLQNYFSKIDRQTTFVFYYNPSSDQLKEFIPDTGGNTLIYASVICLNQPDKISLYGFCINEGSKDLQLTGSFSMLLDVETGFTNLRKKEALLGIGCAFPIINCITKNDGGVILQYENADISQDITGAFKNEVSIVSYNASGEILYQVVLNKSQHCYYGTCGYCCLYDPVKDKLFVIFIDWDTHAQTNDKIRKILYSDKKSGIPVLVSIDAFGSITKKPLLNTIDPAVMICPLLTTQCAPDALLIWGFEKDDYYRLGKLTITE
jgi:hypothetical protein